MTVQRRLELLDWANRSAAWIVEDGYDSEYRYRHWPLPALQSFDRKGRVIYVGTFSKILFPSLRLGYLVAPADLVDKFVNARTLQGYCLPVVDQLVLGDFIAQGDLARRIRRMRVLYQERMEVLVAALHAELAGAVEVRIPEGGMQLVA